VPHWNSSRLEQRSKDNDPITELPGKDEIEINF
jgi:hypothetical protein